MDSSSESDTEKTIADDLVVTKYKMAGKMSNTVMKALIKKCVEGESTLNLCKMGDEMIVKETATVFKKDKELQKGVGFPTSISVNNCVCHYTPLESESNVVVLKNGDVVKIDLAVHIGGFIASAAHTLVVGVTKDNKVTGKQADVLHAAHMCAEAAMRLVKAGNKTNQVTATLQKVAESYGCKPVQGMLSHQLQKNRIDGDKTIILNPSDKQKQDHEESEFDIHEVYAIDCLVSSGEGHPRELDQRTTIYKRNPEVLYQLKMKASRMVFTEIEKKFNAMCFTLRACEDEKKARMGIVECVKHELCTPYPVLFEKEGDFVAQFKFTVLLMPNNCLRITDSFFDKDCYVTEHSVTDPDLKTLLNSSTSKRAAKKKKKKAANKAVNEVQQQGEVVEAAA